MEVIGKTTRCEPMIRFAENKEIIDQGLYQSMYIDNITSVYEEQDTHILYFDINNKWKCAIWFEIENDTTTWGSVIQELIIVQKERCRPLQKSKTESNCDTVQGKKFCTPIPFVSILNES